MSIWGLHHARDLPAASSAPQVGDKAPDFSLADVSGRSVALSELLSEPMRDSALPRAVVLIFYRGYW
jgi:peroxiredoxin